MKKLLLALAALLALACGSGDEYSPDDTVTPEEMAVVMANVTLPDGTRAGPWAEDDPVRQAIMDGTFDWSSVQGESEELDKYLIATGFGIVTNSNGTRCNNAGGWPPLGTSCIVQHDKKARFKWTGTNDVADAYSGKRAFTDANVRVEQTLDANSWDSGTTTSSSNELVFNAALSGIGIGSTSHVNCGNSAQDLVTNPAGGTGWYRKCHGCEIRIDKAKILNMLGVLGDVAKAQSVIQNVIAHEEYHCEGLGHRTQTNYLMHPTSQPSATLNQLNIDSYDATMFIVYQP